MKKDSRPPVSRPPVLVRSYMTRAPRTIGPRWTLAQAHDLMRANRIHHLPVLDAGKLVGIVTQRDLLLIESLPDVNANEVPVEDAMTRAVFVVPSTTPLATVAAEMADYRRGSAVVMDGERVAGVFTVTDACKALVRLLGSPPSPIRSTAARSERSRPR
jgi:acetoin utilization protein AcuB